MIQYENDFRCKQFRQEHLNVPKWAKGERMEMIVPEKELWKWGRFDTPFKSRHREDV